ncbi:MAG: adenylate/guanylate cyclase domain-containing protein [Acidiferrobacterales bacterium]
MDKLNRKLAAILYADVAGYSRLTGDDEEGTHHRLSSCLDLITETIKGHDGNVVHYAGDAVLADFSTVSNGLACAVEIQDGLRKRNADIPEDRRVEFRIGLNLGEVIVDRGDIYGDGVNVAARLESLADPGGICISESVRTAVGKKLPHDYEFMGEQEVKNIAERVRAYRVLLESGASLREAKPSAPALELPDKPSIAVLPFTNMSGDPEQEYFSDGITEDIITALSRMPWFFVIARNSTFAYKGQAVNVKDISRELGVRYVLEGSVRKSGQRLRITAQLIDATTGKHVWAQHYDRELADVFVVQDDVVESIVGAVAPEFLSAEVKRAQHKDPTQLDAWDCVMRGRWHMWRLAREDIAQARQLFERGIELVPSGEFGASDLAVTHLFEAYYNWTDSRARSMQEMMRAAKKAVAADDHDAWAHTALGLANLFAHNWDEALPPLERAIELYPSFAPALGIKCLVLSCLEAPDEAIECFEKARRLSPRDGLIPLWLVGRTWAYLVSKRYTEALASAREFTRLAPDNPTARRQLAACYVLTDQIEKGRQALNDYLQLEPNHTADDIRGRLPARNPEHVERFIEALRLAGLPG